MTMVVPLGGASAHAYLKHASPAAGSTVSHAPKKMSLWFTEAIEPAFSGVVVRNTKGATVDTGKAHGVRHHRTELQVGLKPLPPGTYKVYWHAMSVDTHRTKGSFSFKVGG
ncbi:MAG: copper homeostasis periplasmic binding protein CopC [Pseudolabrys sp.]